MSRKKTSTVLRLIEKEYKGKLTDVYNETNAYGIIECTYKFTDNRPLQVMIRETKDGKFCSGKIFNEETFEETEIV